MFYVENSQILKYCYKSHTQIIAKQQPLPYFIWYPSVSSVVIKTFITYFLTLYIVKNIFVHLLALL